MFRRNIEPYLQSVLRDTPVVLLNGARQTGKSTLAQEIAAQRAGRYVTLDDATTLAAAVGDPHGFLRNLPGMVVVDEVQKAPGLFPAIKILVDADRRPGRFLLTGSANVLLLPQLSESLAGRMEAIPLWPLSQGELADRVERFIDTVFAPRLPDFSNTEKTGIDILSQIIGGGYPEAVAREDTGRRQAWFGAYITAILQRDVRDLAHIEGLTDMPRLLALLAARSGGLLNMSELSRASAIAHTTLKRYLSLLEMTFLFQPLPAWSTNLGKRLVKSPKIHLIDSGLAAYLTGQTSQRLAEDATLLGHLLESFVVAELRKQASWAQERVSLYHFRSTTGREVDVVIEDARGRVVGVEVKATASLTRKDLTGLETLAQAAGDKFIRGVVLYGGDQVIPFGDQYVALPVSALWR
ncbi:MAG: ATP-binding protein [Pseudomonadota bacterium]